MNGDPRQARSHERFHHLDPLADPQLPRPDGPGVAGAGGRCRAFDGNPGLAGSEAAGATQGASFSDTLRGALSGVNEAQQKAGALSKAFEMGDPSADLARVMVASQQSQIAFRATVEVRNRLVQAYQDVMNMPL